jgi:hypothetical protein
MRDLPELKLDLADLEDMLSMKDTKWCPACRQSPVVGMGACSTHLEIQRQVVDAVKICTEAMHSMPACVRLETLKALAWFYQADGSYSSKVNLRE